MLEVYFKEPRLYLNVFSRRLVRIIIWVEYIILAALTFVFLFLLSGSSHFWWSGVFLTLFLANLLLRFNWADRSLNELGRIKRTIKVKANLASYLAPSTYNLIEDASSRASVIGGDFDLWLLKNLLGCRDIKEALQRLELSLPEFSQKLEEYLQGSLNERPEAKMLLGKIEKLVLSAYQEAVLANENFIESRNILVALFQVAPVRSSQGIKSDLGSLDRSIKYNTSNGVDSSSLIRFFNLFNLSPDDLREVLVFGRYRRSLLKRLPAALGGFIRRPFYTRRREVNRAWTSRPTPVLDKFSIDLTELARSEKIGFLIGHKEEYERLLNILSRPAKPAALLVGEPGVGKEVIVKRLAYQIVKDRVSPALFDKRLVSLELSSLVAKATPEELSGRLKQIVDEIIQAGNIILFIPNIDNLVKTSGEYFLSASDILLPAIESGSFPVIGATYPREYQQFIEPRTDLAAAFEIIRVNEASEADSVKILVYDALILENQFRVKIKFGAIKQAVVLSHRYLRAKPLPSSAEEVLKEALANVQNQGRKILEAEDVMATVERQTKIPIQRAGPEETEKLLNLEELIHRRLVNQEEAVKAVSRALREYRSGLSRKGGPIAAFLFVGPTGVGKTELSKILAQLQFGSPELMIRFDMSEYQDKQSIFRFIGSPDGKVPGNLTEAVSQKPYSLILLDEFEKANPDILNLFLQVFDDGRLTDNLGRTVDFQNTIIIATSNAHSEFIKTEIEQGKTMDAIADALKQKLTDYFKPELLNRFSSVIVFRSLKFEEIVQIAKLQLDDLTKILGENQGIELKFEDDVIKKIAELGYSPVFGARPLRQVISENIRGVLAEKILRKEISRGNTIQVTLAGENLEFKVLN
ncbi:MAG: ATP-dependent Clp protease ATP-binding subunit [bacterium]|nr:ATP-dependent Clp protease ATP-binding subunit [bacterium]